jgi:hypothetical protein
MGSKVKGWHGKAPKGEKRRMYEESSSRKPKDRNRQDRKPNESKRVDLNRLPEQDF